ALPGVRGPVALIGLAEKGYMSVELLVEVEGGHSSTPPRETAVGILARAIRRLEENPFPARLDGPPRLLVESLAPHMSFGMRLVTANLWLFEGVVTRLMAGSPETNAAVRTTTAPTMIQAGVKDNILPRQARAVVNFRILPGDTGRDILRHVERTVNDARVRVEVFGGTSNEPSPVSRIDGWGFGQIRAAVQEVFPGTGVAPFLTLGGTDSKHFVDVADDVYRFAPIWYRPELAGGVHGADERIPEADYLGMVAFYYRLLERSGG
ncbi:M20/M25/M40 family metallo-hydrolase, partial [Gemmatimonadota bacterium]